MLAEGLCAMSLSIGLNDQTLSHGDQMLQKVNIPIGQYAEGEDDAPKDQTKYQMNQWQAGKDSCFIIIYLDQSSL